MSVLIKRIDTNSSGGGSSKGYPPGNVTNVKIDIGYKRIFIDWDFPDDIIVGNKTLSSWDEMILMRKEDTPPTNAADGEQIFSIGRSLGYHGVIHSSEPDKTYYYRFFVYDANGVCNNSSDMIYKVFSPNLDPILKNNTWYQIATASQAGSIPSTWKIGDEKDLTLSGKFNETVTMQIWDFNHFDKSYDSGEAGICFGMKNLMKSMQYINTSDTNSGGWNDSYMCNTVMRDIEDSMPHMLISNIKKVNIYASQGGGNTSYGVGKLSKDKVFLPGFTEVFGPSVWSSLSNTETNQKQFPIFTDNNSRIKKMNNGSGNAQWWWTRSPHCNSDNGFCTVSSGGANYNGYAGHNYIVCFCFCV